MTRPSPNSTADSIKKKNVKDRIFILSKIRPVSKAIIYKDIHNSSAVNKRCRAVLTLTEILKKIRKNSNTEKLISPNSRSY
jgi:hypothetical protein